MVQVRGTVHDVSDNPERVERIVVRAVEPRMHGTTYITEESVQFPVVNGVLDFDVLPGPCVVAFLRNHGATTYEKLLVPDVDEASFRECLDAAALAEEGTKSALEKVVRQIQEELGKAAPLLEEVRGLRTEVSNDRTAADGFAKAAKASASAAASSEAKAKTSETNAANSAASAKSQQESAKTHFNNTVTEAGKAADSAAAAKSSETKAATSASASASSAASSKTQSDKSTASATQAAASRDAAKASETNAAGSAAAAKTSETNAAQSSSSANTHRAAAATQASAASESASQAATARDAAKQSQTAAKTSETNANTHRQAAATSASKAATHETNAGASAAAAADSAILAGRSESNAKTSETNAKAHEQAAKAAATSGVSTSLASGDISRVFQADSPSNTRNVFEQDHYGTGYSVDIQNMPGANSAIVVHNYSNEEAVIIDNCDNETALEINNTINTSITPDNIAKGNFFDLAPWDDDYRKRWYLALTDDLTWRNDTAHPISFQRINEVTPNLRPQDDIAFQVKDASGAVTAKVFSSGAISTAGNITTGGSITANGIASKRHIVMKAASGSTEMTSTVSDDGLSYQNLPREIRVRKPVLMTLFWEGDGSIDLSMWNHNGKPLTTYGSLPANGQQHTMLRLAPPNGGNATLVPMKQSDATGVLHVYVEQTD